MREPYEPEPGEVRKCGVHWEHDWSAGSWGVIVGVSKCRRCLATLSSRDIPSRREVQP